MSADWAIKISLTDRCNFRCHYCIQLPQILSSSNRQMSLARVRKALEAARAKGIQKVLWTGGEPTLGPIAEVVSMAKELGFTEQGITSNGFLLDSQVEQLAQSGLTRANISIDSLCESKFFEITKANKLRHVVRCIEKCAKLLSLTKMNMVVMRCNLDEIADFVEFQKSLDSKVILKLHEMWEVTDKPHWEREHVAVEEIRAQLKEIGELHPAHGINSSNPGVEYYQFGGTDCVVGIARKPNSHVCEVTQCTKLRIYPNGKTCEGRNLLTTNDWEDEFEELMDARQSAFVENNSALSDKVGLKADASN